jgi:demethylmenaquinone methyltransferase / 2-methoxy-6-polyprenyl-1,4-benzoquinol methylase
MTASIESEVDSPVLPPHPELTLYYSGERGKRTFLNRMFNDTAVDYDRVENVLALGSGRWYRRQALLRGGLKPGMKALDVAMGTGLVTREAKEIVGSNGYIVGIDPSSGMLNEARSSLNVPAVLGVGESLPFGDAQFDFVSMGYALRHLSNLNRAFAEYFRILRPGGTVCVLEIARPTDVVRLHLVRAYFKCLLPMIARLMDAKPSTRSLWEYYWETIDRCVPPETVMDALRSAGFTDVRRHMAFGLFSEYVGTRLA